MKTKVRPEGKVSETEHIRTTLEPAVAPVARLNTDRARRALQEFRFSDLFVDELGWNNPTNRAPVQLRDRDNRIWSAKEISQLSGFRVFEVTSSDAAAALPDAKSQQLLWKALTAQAVENIAIFVDQNRTQSLWLWIKREQKRFLPRRHHFLKGQPGDLFLSKLAALVVDLAELDEHGNLPITETANRVRAALDVETVTKAFFRDFQEEHGKLLQQIRGISDARERRWYASVLLNRLMFVWFLQAKGFLDSGNRNYLPEKLATSQQKARGQFFARFLRDLFFEGFAKPTAKRKPVGQLPLGDIPYLNGGLFLPHGIEQRIEGDALLSEAYAKIAIPDSAFADLFGLFHRYSWSLNDTPGGDDREINPAVLGYIFEKYINQKEFGAYYTRPEITEYLCEQTIHQLVLDHANGNYEAAQKLHTRNPKTFPAPRRFDALDDLLFRADGPMCARLLHDVLPRFSLLDPACGSGAFLVAAQKTLLNLYTALIGRCEALGHRPVLDWIERERRAHKAPAAYWLKKKIVTENLYGVDLMEEATEIAKLRLFLSLVASADTRDQLEPLPNIEFNILAGNSLIGLLHVDPSAFEIRAGARKNAGRVVQERIEFEQSTSASELGMTFTSKTAPSRKETEGAHLAGVRAAKYAELLSEKNRLIAQYKEAPTLLGAGLKDSDVLVSLRRSIEDKKAAAREVLDRLLLAEFQRLGIKFEQATWDERKNKEGRPERRTLKLDDIRALQPFHWAYEFDEILIARGGFDAIITNPPWETFQPDAKEFFAEHSDLVTKKKMDIKAFEYEIKRILHDEEIKEAWLDYHSRFNHQRNYFRFSPQYENQVPIINGKRHGKDVNLFKLFIEQSYHLLATTGLCGIVIPSGIYTDLGAMKLRELLFSQTKITGLLCFDNRKAIFEGVHRSYKFVVLTFRKGGRTESFPAAFMRQDVTDVSLFPEQLSLPISVELIRRLSPDSLSILEFKSKTDIRIAEKMLRYPLLGEFDASVAWNLELHREFNMTDDAHLFHESEVKGGIALYEGKMIWQFDHRYSEPRYWVIEAEGRKALLGDVSDEGQELEYETYRIAYRSVGENTNERNFISTVLPRRHFCGNSLNLSKGFDLAPPVQLFICALFNSFVLDYAMRMKISRNLNMFYVFQLPIPRLTNADAAFSPLVERAARLVGTTAEFDDLLREVFGPKATHRTHGSTKTSERERLRAELDALVAQLYDLTEEEFQHILSTFPLVPESTRLAPLQTYSRLVRREKLS
jgi:hypothetical protein